MVFPLGAVIGGIGTLAGGLLAGKAAKRQRAAFEQERARLAAIAGRARQRLEPIITAGLEGREPVEERLARRREELLAEQRLGRAGEAARRTFIDRLARIGATTSRAETTSASPAALAQLQRIERGTAEDIRELAIRLAAENARRRAALRQQAVGTEIDLARLEAGLSPGLPPATSFGPAIAAGFSELLTQSLADIFARRRAGGVETFPKIPPFPRK